MYNSDEQSSDCSDTILFSISVNENQNFNETDVESIINKYISEKCEAQVNTLCEVNDDNNVIELSDGEPDDGPSIKKIKKAESVERKEVLSDSSSSTQEDSNELLNDALLLQKLSEKYKKNSDQENHTVEDVDESKALSNKQIKMLEKQQKSEERKRKKIEANREKSLKQALATAHKNLKPGECMKFICTYIDNDIVSEEYGDCVMKALQDSDISYTITSQIIPNTVSWTRKTQSHVIDNDGKLVPSSEDSDTDEMLLIINCKEFVDHVHNNSLISHIQSFKSILPHKKFTLIIYGLQKYTKFQKNQKQKEFAAAVSDNYDPKQSKTFQNFPIVSTKTIEYALTELQLLCNCSHRLLNSPAEVGLIVAQFSKAIAEVPYKLQKQEKYQQTDWFASGDNRDCVKVDKNGNGIQRLWKQMLTTFPMTSLETAEAITAIYPTMTSLMQAYEDKTLEKPELLLQDIPIRRAAGPLSSMRRLGPELSKKVYNYFTAMDGDISL